MRGHAVEALLALGRVVGERSGRREAGGGAQGAYHRMAEGVGVEEAVQVELSLTRAPRNIWASATCRQFLALGPFAWEGKPNSGLDEPFINETAVSGGTAPGQEARGKGEGT